jgi:hypothetical protein
VELSFVQSGGRYTIREVSYSAGGFDVTLPTPGSWAVTASRIGYEPAGPDTLVLPSDQVLDVRVRLRVRALELPLIEVVAARQPPSALEAVYARIERMRELGIGRSFTRDQIERLNPQSVGGVLRAMSSQLRVVESQRMVVNTVFVRGGAWGAGYCPPAVFIDGFRVNQRPTNVNMLIEPRHIEAIELYIGAAQTPLGFHDPTGCGSILIWSRRGSPEEGAPHSWKRYAIAAGFTVAVLLLLR